MVVATCAGDLPAGYCRSPRSFGGSIRTAVSVVSTSRRLSNIDSSGITSTLTVNRLAMVSSFSNRTSTTVSLVALRSGGLSGPAVHTEERKNVHGNESQHEGRGDDRAAARGALDGSCHTSREEFGP